MQVFPLKIQYLKVLTDFFRNKSVKASEFHMMSDSTVQYFVNLKNTENLHVT